MSTHGRELVGHVQLSRRSLAAATVRRMDLMAAAEAERLTFADLLESLSEDDWERPSLCEDWTVRDVVAHVLSYEDLSRSQNAALMVRAAFRLPRVNPLALAPFAAAGPDELVERMRSRSRPHGTTAGFGGGIGLVDAMVHQQDVRRALGRPRDIDPDALRYAVLFAARAPVLHGLWTTRGTRLVATDLDTTVGWGPEAAGPGEVVLMTLGGRRGVASELTGPGRERLVRRLG